MIENSRLQLLCDALELWASLDESPSVARVELEMLLHMNICALERWIKDNE
jgi:hypothetical protein